MDDRRDVSPRNGLGRKRPASTTFASWSIASSPISRTHCRSAATSEVELVREGATLLLRRMTGMLAGRTWRARLGSQRLPFGFPGTILYTSPAHHLWLAASLCSDWAFFLLPLPGGAGARARLYRTTDDRVGHSRHSTADRIRRLGFTRASWRASWAGILLALGGIHADSIRAARRARRVRRALPTAFNWPVFRPRGAPAIAAVGAPGGDRCRAAGGPQPPNLRTP